MRFAKKVAAKCLHCRAPLEADGATLCAHCTPKQAEIYQKSLAAVNDLEVCMGVLRFEENKNNLTLVSTC